MSLWPQRIPEKNGSESRETSVRDWNVSGVYLADIYLAFDLICSVHTVWDKEGGAAAAGHAFLCAAYSFPFLFSALRWSLGGF